MRWRTERQSKSMGDCGEISISRGVRIGGLCGLRLIILVVIDLMMAMITADHP